MGDSYIYKYKYIYINIYKNHPFMNVCYSFTQKLLYKLV